MLDKIQLYLKITQLCLCLSFVSYIPETFNVQFFLSDRAVYLLMWNIRLGHEHAGLDFWLSSISVHAPKAPIFVVGTHVDQVVLLPKNYVCLYTYQCVSALCHQCLRAITARPHPNMILYVAFVCTSGKWVEGKGEGRKDSVSNFWGFFGCFEH